MFHSKAATDISALINSAIPTHAGELEFRTITDDGDENVEDVSNFDGAKIKAFLESHPDDEVAMSLFRIDGIPFGLTLVFDADHPAIARLPSPTAKMASQPHDGAKGKVALTYMFEEGEDVSSLAVLCKPGDYEDWELSADMPLPRRHWLLESDGKFPMFSVAEVGRDIQLALRGSYKLNDAEVYGEIPVDIKNLPIRIAHGASQAEKSWKTSEAGPFGIWLENHLSIHKAGKKDGPCFVTGALADSKRTKKSVTALYALGLDVDSGAPLSETFHKIQELELFAVIYTTHSHGTSEIRISQDNFQKWAKGKGLNPSPSTEAVRVYLTEEGKYVPDVVASAEYRKIDHDGMGIHLVVQTRPIDKFRIIFPLKEPYIIARRAMPQSDALRQWERVVTEVGNLIGVPIDRAARDASRLFFYPRHKKGGEYRILVTGRGNALDWEKIESDASFSNPFATAAQSMGSVMAKANSERPITPGGLDLKAWAKHMADHFELSRVFKDHCEDRIRPPELASGKWTVECPYDDEHTNAGDPDDKGCFIQDAGVGAETFQFRCSHNACSGRDRLNMLQKAISDGWFQEDMLTDPAYSCMLDDEFEVARGKVLPTVRMSGAWSDAFIDIDEKGALSFGKSCPYKHATLHARPAFGKWQPDGAEGGKVAPICQEFRVTSVASDANGGGASITIEFETAHNGTQEVTFSRASLFDRQEVLKALAEKWFVLEDAGDTLGLLKSLTPRIDTLLVDRTGWYNGAFLHPSGTSVHALSAEAGATRKLRMRGGTQAGEWRGGTLDGWKAAVAPVFEDDANGREQFALGVMAGCAGAVAGFVGLTGFPILNLHGNTSRGKSTSLMLAASACGAPNQKGAYHSLRKTDNGMESILAARSGITIAFDEGKTTNADVLDNVIWMMAHGVGKTRATVAGDSRPEKEFCGFVMTANEIPLGQMMSQAKKSQPGGFHARVCDVDVSGIPELVGEQRDRIFAGFAETKKHYGHAWEAVVRHLQSLGIEYVQSELDRLAKELAGRDADAFTTRSAKALALVWLSGVAMEATRLIPSCDLARVVKWAWGTRAVESTLDPFTKAMEALLTSVTTRRGVDIYALEDVEDRRLKEAVGFIYKPELEELLLVATAKLPELCGGHMGLSTLRNQMLAKEMLVKTGGQNPKPSWAKLPNGRALSHYRVVLTKVAAFTDN